MVTGIARDYKPFDPGLQVIFCILNFKGFHVGLLNTCQNLTLQVQGFLHLFIRKLF